MNADRKLVRSMLMKMGRKQANLLLDECGLTDEEKSKIIMCYVDNRPLDIVADELFIDTRTLKRHLQRALQKLTYLL